MKDRIIAVNSNSYHGYSIEDALEGISRAGFRYVELTATKGWTEHVFPDQSFECLESVKTKMEELGLTAVAMSGHCNLVDPDRREDFIKNIKLAHFFGCTYIVSSIGEAHLEDKASEDDERTAALIKEYIPYLEKYNLQLVLECHGEHGTGAIVDRIVRLIDSDRIRINYDTANVIFYGQVVPEEDMASCADHISYIHLKDKAGEAKEWNFPALGEGNVHFDRIFSLLEEKGNKAPFSIEIEFTPEGAGSLEQVNKAVETSAVYLTSKGFRL